MSTLDFVPRSIKRRRVEDSSAIANAQSPPITSIRSLPRVDVDTGIDSTNVPLPRSNSNSFKRQKKQHQDVEPSIDQAILVWLAISDYSLWIDAKLRCMVNSEGTNGSHSDEVDDAEGTSKTVVDETETQSESNDRAYVPLDYLLNDSNAFRLVSLIQPYCDLKEIVYVNALRKFAAGEIDVRYIVDPESSSTRASVNHRRRRIQSGHEVRRNDFASLKDSEFSRFSKANWDELTLYMENIPAQFRKVPAIARLTTALLPHSSKGSSFRRVQNITFPLHHRDQLGSIPACKGFALVTLSTKDDVQALIDAWPWERPGRPHGPSNAEHGDMTVDEKAQTSTTQSQTQSQETKSAISFGLRICSKARWEGLKAEYLLYRQQLVEDINRYQDEEDTRCRDSKGETVVDAQHSSNSETASVAVASSKSETTVAQEDSRLRLHADSRYPSGCLVFVRHVHPGTNKTTLRSLFKRAWKGDGATEDCVDYIDYSKNMDSCYIRFSTPAHAEYFVDYFSSHYIIQFNGLDDLGSEVVSREGDGSSTSKPILPETVLGKREEIYWEKVPEKTRKQAVAKTLKVVYDNHVGGDFASEIKEKGVEGGGKKKRRNKGKASD